MNMLIQPIMYNGGRRIHTSIIKKIKRIKCPKTNGWLRHLCVVGLGHLFMLIVSLYLRGGWRGWGAHSRHAGGAASLFVEEPLVVYGVTGGVFSQFHGVGRVLF